MSNIVKPLRSEKLFPFQVAVWEKSNKPNVKLQRSWKGRDGKYLQQSIYMYPKEVELLVGLLSKFVDGKNPWLAALAAISAAINSPAPAPA